MVCSKWLIGVGTDCKSVGRDLSPKFVVRAVRMSSRQTMQYYGSQIHTPDWQEFIPKIISWTAVSKYSKPIPISRSKPAKVVMTTRPLICRQNIKLGQQDNWQKNYLYRDYLGSSIPISDEVGLAAERYQFDTWGNITKLEQIGSAITMPTDGAVLLQSIISSKFLQKP